MGILKRRIILLASINTTVHKQLPLEKKCTANCLPMSICPKFDDFIPSSNHYTMKTQTRNVVKCFWKWEHYSCKKMLLKEIFILHSFARYNYLEFCDANLMHFLYIGWSILNVSYHFVTKIQRFCINWFILPIYHVRLWNISKIHKTKKW